MRKLTSEEMIDYYDSLVQKYPVLSIEDGLAEQDWDSWTLMTKTPPTRLSLLMNCL